MVFFKFDHNVLVFSYDFIDAKKRSPINFKFLCTIVCAVYTLLALNNMLTAVEICDAHLKHMQS